MNKAESPYCEVNNVVKVSNKYIVVYIGQLGVFGLSLLFIIFLGVLNPAWACWGCYRGYSRIGFSPDGRWIAACSGYAFGKKDDETSVWRVADGKRVFHIGHGTNIAFDKGGRLAIASTQDKKPYLWIIDVEAARILYSFPVGDGKNASVSQLAWGPEGSLFTWQSGGRSYLPLRCWSLKGDKLNDFSTCAELKLSSDGRWAAFGGDKDLRLVDLKNFSVVRIWKGAVLFNLGFGNKALYFHRDEMIVRVDPVTLEEASSKSSGFTWALPSGLLATVREEQTGSGSTKTSMELFNFGVQQPMQTLDTGPGIGSADGRWFANGAGIWDVYSGAKVATFSRKNDCREVAFSPDSRIAAYSEGRSVVMHYLLNGKQKTLSASAIDDLSNGHSPLNSFSLFYRGDPE